MTFRRKLLLVFTLTVALSVIAVALLVSATTRRAFESTNDQRTGALVTQFQRQFSQQGEEIARRVEQIAGSEPLARLAASVERSPGDFSGYLEMTKSLGEGYRLDFLEFVDSRGTIISSAQWPAKFGYPESAAANLASWANQPAFLKQEDLQDGTALGLFAVRITRVSEHPVYVIGGRRLDKSFLSALDLPADMRVLLYQNRGQHFSPDWLIDPANNSSTAAVSHPADKLAPLIDGVRQQNQEMTQIVHWSADKADDELFHAFPLRGIERDRPVLAILLVANSRRAYVTLERKIRDSALLVGGGGILLAVLLGSWAAARVTRPVEQLFLRRHRERRRRVLVATHRDLEQRVREEKFRQDLFHRIYVFPLVLPPLRERREDIPTLVEHFSAQVSTQNGWKPVTFTAEAMQCLQAYAWPGNVRELRNMVERLMLLTTDDHVDVGTVQLALPTTTAGNVTHSVNSGPLADRVQSFERDVMLDELKRSQYNVTLAAKSLGLERSHFYKKAEQLGVDVQSVRREQTP